jgi:hypothetical protein
MVIAFSCSCGKALKSQEAYAGRQVKCPKCGKVMTIPQAVASDEALTVTPVSMERAAPPVEKPAAPPVTSAKDTTAPQHSPPPLARPVAQPTAFERKAEPASGPAPVSVHAWIDNSLVQRPTPWLPGDEARFQKGVSAPHEGMGGLEKVVLGLLVLAGVAASGWYLFARR